MALTGYPQTHNSPELMVVLSAAENDTTQYEGPFSSIKVLSDSNTEHAELWLYLDSESYNTAQGSQVAGTHYYIVNALATDTITGPIYGFRFHTNSEAGCNIIAYKYSTSIL